MTDDKRVVTQSWIKNYIEKNLTNVSVDADSDITLTYSQLTNDPYPLGVKGSKQGIIVSLIYESKSGGTNNYTDNQVVIREDIDYENIVDYSGSDIAKYTVGTIDTMGGISNLTASNLSNLDTTTHTLLNEPTNPIWKLFKIGDETGTVYNIQGTYKLVFSNLLNVSDYATVTFPNNTTGVATRESKLYGYFTSKGTESVEKDTNAQDTHIWSGLKDTSVWVKDGKLNDYTTGINNGGTDWYNIHDVLMEQGLLFYDTGLLSDKISNYLGTTNSYSKPYRFSWNNAFNDGRLFYEDTFSLTNSCPRSLSLKDDEDTVYTADVGIYYKRDYKQFFHLYEFTSVLYAEAYPNIFTRKGGLEDMALPIIMNYTVGDVNPDSIVSYSLLGNFDYISDYLNPDTEDKANDYKYLRSRVGTVNDSYTSITEPKNAKFNKGTFTYGDNESKWTTGIYFMSPEICKRDEDNNIIYDTDGALLVTGTSNDQEELVTTTYFNIYSIIYSSSTKIDEGSNDAVPFERIDKDIWGLNRKNYTLECDNTHWDYVTTDIYYNTNPDSSVFGTVPSKAWGTDDVINLHILNLDYSTNAPKKGDASNNYTYDGTVWRKDDITVRPRQIRVYFTYPQQTHTITGFGVDSEVETVTATVDTKSRTSTMNGEEINTTHTTELNPVKGDSGWSIDISPMLSMEDEITSVTVTINGGSDSIKHTIDVPNISYVGMYTINYAAALKLVDDSNISQFTSDKIPNLN